MSRIIELDQSFNVVPRKRLKHFFDNNLYILPNYKPKIFFYGVDLDTKEIKYYTFYDRNLVYTPNMLHEIDPNSLDECYASFFEGDSLRRENTYAEMSAEYMKMLDDIISSHREFNKKADLPTSFMDDNLKYLKIHISKDKLKVLVNPFVECNEFAYNPFCNSLKYGFTEEIMNSYNTKEKEQLSMDIAHEICHLKTSELEFSEDNNTLLVKSGFVTDTLQLIEITTDVGDSFYFISGFASERSIDIVRIDEIMTDYETRLAIPSFRGYYPDLGERLNNLTDGLLLTKKYSHDISCLKEAILRIENNISFYNEFLRSFSNLSYYGYLTKTKEMLSTLEEKKKRLK